MFYELLLSWCCIHLLSERDEGFSECWLWELAGWWLVLSVGRELWSLLYTASYILVISLISHISRQEIENSTENIWRNPPLQNWVKNDCWLINLCIRQCDELVLTLLWERERESVVVMFSSWLVFPLLLTLVEGLDTVSLDNIAFRQEASQSLTLGQYKPGT